MFSKVVSLALLVGLTALAPGRLAAAAPAAPSSGLNDWSCRPSSTHPRPVVLLHGLSSSSQQWLLHGTTVAKAGYCAFSLDYGANSTGANGNAPVARSGEEIGRFIDRVLSETDASKVDLVGHSLGGFMALWVPKVAGYGDRVGTVVSLTPPTHGTTLFGALALAERAGLRPVLTGLLGLGGCFACADLLAGSAATDRLTQGPIAQPGIRYVVIATRYDAIVTPASQGFIREPGVENYYVQDKCPADPVGHFGIGFDTGVGSMILHGLDPAVPVKCGFGPPV
ncbi:alpha/beta fold hydrolase [Marmoricola sp. OAE513]|uniref:esterase/lipase family protein n=1 Tax=Marmoricola sp. OAE513 TaxID=2817894 RepID=UPI001AEAD6C7